MAAWEESYLYDEIEKKTEDMSAMKTEEDLAIILDPNWNKENEELGRKLNRILAVNVLL